MNIKIEIQQPSPHGWKKYLLPLVLTILIFGGIVFYLLNNIEQYRQLFSFNKASLAQLMGLALFTIFTNGGINFILYRSLGLDISYPESVGVSSINSLGNQLPIPGGGLVVTSMFMKRFFKLDYFKYLSSALALYILSVSVNGLISLFILLYWALVKDMSIPAILFLGYGGMSAVLLVFLLPVEKLQLPEKWKRRLEQVVLGWTIFRHNKKLAISLLGIQVINMVILAFEFKISFSMFSQVISHGQGVLFATSNILTQLVSITPDAVGVRETLIGGIASLLGFNLGTSVLSVTLIRLVVFPVILIVGLIFLIIFRHKLKKDTGELTERDQDE